MASRSFSRRTAASSRPRPDSTWVRAVHVVGHAVEARILRQVAEPAGVVHDAAGRHARAGQDLEQGGLAGAVAADEADLVAGAHRERHAVEEDRPACFDPEVPGLEHRSRAGTPSRPNPSRNSVRPVTELARSAAAATRRGALAHQRLGGGEARRRRRRIGSRPWSTSCSRTRPPSGSATPTPCSSCTAGGSWWSATGAASWVSSRRWPGSSLATITADTPLISWSMAKSMLHAVVGTLVLDGRLSLEDRPPVAAWEGAGDPRRRHHLGPPAPDAAGSPVGRGVLRVRGRRAARRRDDALRRRAGGHGRLRRRLPARPHARFARGVQLLERHVEHRLRRGRHPHRGW